MTKRVLICVGLGFLAGGVCLLGMRITGRADLTPVFVTAVLLDRLLLGFILGVSGWRARWAFEGVVVGLLASAPIAVLALDGSPAALRNFLIFELAGAVYGVLIQLGAALLGAGKPRD